MLSTSPIKNVAHAGHYFMSEDNYYTAEQGMLESQWFGNAARILECSGQVDADQFNQLLGGKLLNNQHLGRKQNNEIRHRPGWDLTFSAPKSVSLLAILGGDERLLIVHREAVLVAMSAIERGCSQVRTNTPEGTLYQNTGNLVAALFHHDLSREKDPALHTHCVVMNITQRKDGAWRSQASQFGRYDGSVERVNGFIERVRHDKQYYGLLYRAELAHGIKALGYRLDIDGKTGRFEIAGVTRDVIDLFSKRRAEILSKLSEKGWDGAKAAEFVTLSTRSNKEKNVDRVELRENWKEQAKSLLFDCYTLIQRSYEIEKEVVVTPAKKLIESLHGHARDLSFFQETFTPEVLLTRAARSVIHMGATGKDLLIALKSLEESGKFLKFSNKDGKFFYILASSRDMESQLLMAFDKQKNSQAVIKNEVIQRYTNQNLKLSNQRLESIFHKPLTLLEGAEIMPAVQEILAFAKSANHSVLMLSSNVLGADRWHQTLSSFTGKAPQNIWEKLKALWIKNENIHFESVSKYLKQNDDRKRFTSKIVLVDKAHLLGTQQMASLLAWHHQNKNQLILIGDPNGLSPNVAGMPYQQLRQRDANIVSVDLSSDWIKTEGVKGLVKLCTERPGCVVEVLNTNERGKAIAAQFALLFKEEREKSWLISQNKRAVAILNNEVHQALAAKNRIQDIKMFSVLIPVSLGMQQLKEATNYKVGQYLRFNHEMSSAKIQASAYFKIQSINKKRNELMLSKDSTNAKILITLSKLSFDQSQGIELFNEKQQAFGVGEMLVSLRKISKANLFKGERCILTKMDKNTLTFKTNNDKIIALDLNRLENRHLDYGYAASLSSIAHERPQHLFVDFPSRSVAKQPKIFHQAITQAEKAWFYTDNLSQLAQWMAKQSHDLPSVHNVIKHADQIKKNVEAIYQLFSKAVVNQETYHSSIDALRYAFASLSDREAGFSHKDVMKVALKYALGNVDIKVLETLTLAAENAGILLRGKRDDGTLWTTIDAVSAEREIIALTTQGKRELFPIASLKDIASSCDLSSLNDEQKNAVTRLVQSRDRVNVVQGYAGTGKTTMLVQTQNAMQKAGFSVMGLAPTHTAVGELTQRHISAATLSKFLSYYKDYDPNVPYAQKTDNMVLFLDESSMVSNQNMLTLLQITRRLNSRLEIVGDMRQLSAIESGKPAALQQQIVDPIVLKDIRRQKNPILKDAVSHVIQKRFDEAIKVLGEQVVEVPDNDERIARLVENYFDFSEKERQSILIITPAHADRVAVNKLIRKQRVSLGEISDKSYQVFILVPQSRAATEMTKAQNFDEGDILRFSRGNGEIKAGEYLTVESIHRQENILELRKNNGDLTFWQLPNRTEKNHSEFECFKSKKQLLAKGDKIRWRRQDKANDIAAHDEASVLAIDKASLHLRLDNDREIKLDLKDPKSRHWDYAYASTVYQAQGKTKNIVLALLDSFRENLVNQPALLVSLTRAVETFKLFTDNKEDLLKALALRTGTKHSALEIIGEYQKIEITENKKPKNISKDKIKFKKIDKQLIREGLRDQVESFVCDLLGKPKVRQGGTLRFGQKQGSLVVSIQGPQKGLWHDFAPSDSFKGGDLLALIQKKTNCQFNEALTYGATWLGILNNKKINKVVPSNVQIEKSLSKQAPNAYKEKMVKYAQKLAAESLSLKGTLAERYLSEHRGLSLSEYPDDVRFHPCIYVKQHKKNYPALIVLARNANQQIKAVQVTYLDNVTAKKAEVDIKKQTFGPLKETSVLLTPWKSNFDITFITEGVETGLSIAKAIPGAEVRATLGKSNFLHLDGNILANKIFFCLDNDGKNFKTDLAVINAAQRLSEQKKAVSFMFPNHLGANKQDYNDVLKHLGEQAIQKDFREATSFKSFERKNFSVNSKVSNAIFQNYKEKENEF